MRLAMISAKCEDGPRARVESGLADEEGCETDKSLNEGMALQ
jgi:hypothetical protein